MNTCDLILTELRKRGIHYKKTLKDIIIRCPFHSDKTPSLSIHKNGKAAHCFSCRWSGTWNDVAKKLDLKGIDDDQLDADIQLIKDELKGLERRSAPAGLPPAISLTRWNKDWRGIPASILQEVSAYEWYDTLNPKRPGYRLLLPITFYGELQGWTARAIDTDLEPKHRHSFMTSSLQMLFPVDYVLKHFSNKTVALVEGPHDALAGITMGIPTLSIQGTGNWSAWKKAYLSVHFESLVLIMDGDPAGRQAQATIYNEMVDHMPVLPISLHEGDDPGSLIETQEKRYQWKWITGEISKFIAKI